MSAKRWGCDNCSFESEDPERVADHLAERPSHRVFVQVPEEDAE